METPEPAQEPQLINDDPRDPTGAKALPRFDLPEQTTERTAAPGSGDSSPFTLFSWATENALFTWQNKSALGSVSLEEFLYRGKN